MLQQTRVSAVIPYYEHFMTRFPDVASLAEAPEQDLLAHWAGLGYYYRARNLQRAAQAIVTSGAFPRDYEAIRALPGIGDYTASAIASISFDLPHAVLDGNVSRVLSRLLADATNIASTAGKRNFTAIARNLLDAGQAGAFNQAVMELGAIVCLPKNPQCLVCPISEQCVARQTGTQNNFPVKIVPRKSVQESRILFWAERDGHVLAWQRPPESRLMPGFWELPEREQLPHLGPSAKIGSFRHSITFHKYLFEVWRVSAPSDPAPCQWIDLARLKDLPVSTVFRKAHRVVSAPDRRKATVRAAPASLG